MPPRSDIEAIDQPTVLYILRTYIVQKVSNRRNVCLKMLPKMTPSFPKVVMALIRQPRNA